MAVTGAQAAQGPKQSRPASAALGAEQKEPGTKTLLDSDVAMPGHVAPGDGPFDTLDASEHATSVIPDKGAAAVKGFGVVNAVLPIPDPSGFTQARAKQSAGEKRTETYELTGPDGKPVQVTHDLDTGETSTA